MKWPLCVAFLVCAASAAAQTVTPSLTNVTRVESWRFFDPPPDTSDPRYTFIGNRAKLSIDVTGARLDLGGGFSYTRLENLPRNAIGPGGLGSGAFYYAASGVPYSYQVFVSRLTARVHGDRWSLVAGRMAYESGAEAPTDDGALDVLKRLRLQARLVGTFDWSMYERRFDGVRADVTGAGWRATAVALVPTQGGFEESANLWMPTVQVAGAAWTVTSSPGHRREGQVFAFVYRDRRNVLARPDNTGGGLSRVRVTVATAGASRVAIHATRVGEVDSLVWGAAQAGDWYGQSHRAASAAAEAGVRLAHVPWRPWLRGGALWASGDRDALDGHHGTFFQMLPSSRTYALSFTYAQMNLADVFAQALVEPHRRVSARVDAHWLDLASVRDRWYQGSGATAREGRYFGYSSRPSGGARRLGTVFESSANVALSRLWSMNAYAGRIWGGNVVRASFAGTTLWLVSIESVLGF